MEYDYILADIDSPEAYEGFSFGVDDIHFFVTTFDVYSLQRGINIIKNFKTPISVTKVLFTRNPSSEESEYIDFISLSYKVKWKPDVVYFPFETDDLYAIYENQRFSKVRFVNLSNEFMDSLMFMLEIASGASKNEIRKAIKLIERA